MIPSLFRSCLIVLLAMSGLDAAELPKKAPLSRYQSLWQNSPFTTPPKQEVGAPLPDVFGDWALKGIAPIGSGYLITLINKKNPAEAVPPIDTDQPSEYQVLRIERDPDKALGTVVYLSKGDITGSVTFDEKLSVPKPTVAKAVPKKNAGTAPTKTPAPQQSPAPVHQPRPRVVVPAPPSGNQPSGRGNGRSGNSNYQRPSGR